MAYTVTKNADGDVNLGSLAGEIVTLQPAASDYVPGGYALIGGESGVATPSTINVDLWRISSALPWGGQGGYEPVWNPVTQSVQIYAGTPVAGVPLTLGTLSAAATQSTFTVAGLLTVVGANTLLPGQFIVLSNGASSYGLQFSGVMTQVVSATATQYTSYIGQALANAYTINTDTLKYQVVQANAGNLLQAQQLAAPITGVLATAILLTVTQTNSLVAGQFVALGNGFKAASYYCNGAIVQVTSATSSGWTAKWVGTIIAQTSGETATASLLVTNGGAPVIASQASFGAITNSLAVASDTTHAGLLSLTSVQNFAAGNILAVQGVGANTTLNGVIATVISASLTNIMIKANGWTVIANTSAETVGVASLLVTGTPTMAQPEVPAGTDLSGYAFQLLLLGY
jgi:hypothetical protein